MEERSIQVDSVVVAASQFPHVEDAGLAQVADQAPDSTWRQSQGVRDLTDRAIRINGYIEDDGTMAGNEVKGVDDCPPPPTYITLDPCLPLRLITGC